MGWDVQLGELEASEIDAVLLHPEHTTNLQAVTWLLERFDAANTAEDLYDFQAQLFRASYRAQLAADRIGRTVHRVNAGKTPDWPGPMDAETATFVDPPWHLRCAPESTAPEEWVLERRVAERVIRQLRAVGDALAWRVHRYDRRVIIALSRNDLPGPFVGKAGLDAELGKITEIREQQGNFALLHDLTSVMRVLDATEIERTGRRMLHEIKSSDSSSARAKARKQTKHAERLLAAIDGSAALPGEEVMILWRARAQLRTHVRDLVPMLERAAAEGFAAIQVADRVVSAFHLLPAAGGSVSVQEVWNAYVRRRDDLLLQRLGIEQGCHRLRATSIDSAARDPATAPWGIYPLPAHLRAALICDYLILESFLAADQVAARFHRRRLNAQVLLPVTGNGFDEHTQVLQVTDNGHGVVVHGNAMYQLLMEFVRTDRFIDAIGEVLKLPDPSIRSLLTYSNERAAWR
ncbi:hypothetical protein ACIRP3_41715 [Streptomyces sp. NPDC101209]|uniref:hypothetical protein n=1 Tax=Streptomyces sp. NPDC101209 TaxID=3366129 RepID=UPI00382F1062